MAMDAEPVAFRYKDSRDGERKVMWLPGQEFVRRFLLHVLPKGFMRIRHFGFLANRCRRDKLEQIRKCLAEAVTIDRPQGVGGLRCKCWDRLRHYDGPVAANVWRAIPSASNRCTGRERSGAVLVSTTTNRRLVSKSSLRSRA